jgi:hypothetical protein
MARYPNKSRSAGRCAVCGKVNFVSRKEAKVAGKQYGDARLSVYRCGDYWHLGTLPLDIRRGVKGREVLRERQEFLRDIEEQRARGRWVDERPTGEV